MERYCLIVFLICLFGCNGNDDNLVVEPKLFSSLELDSVAIFGEHSNHHNAFPGLVKHDDDYYITFRSSDEHVWGENGKVEIYKTTDFINWEQVNVLSNDTLDLRDPFLLVANNELRVYFHGSKYVDKKLLAAYDFYWDLSGNTYEVQLENNSQSDVVVKGNIGWPWRVNYFNDQYHTFAYSWGNNVFEFFSSDDGRSFQNVSDTLNRLYDDVKMECSFGTWGDRVIGLVRNWHTKDRLIYSDDNGKSWNTLEILPTQNIGGPDIEIIGDKLIFGGRVTENGERLVKFYSYDLLESELDFLVELPGDHDNGYPDILLDGDKILIAYYAANESGGTSVRIAFTNVLWEEINE